MVVLVVLVGGFFSTRLKGLVTVVVDVFAAVVGSDGIVGIVGIVLTKGISGMSSFLIRVFFCGDTSLLSASINGVNLVHLFNLIK